MSYDTTTLYKSIDLRLAVPKPTEEELAQIIYEAVLHCIQYKAQAIEAVEKLSKERASHD